MLKLTIKVGPNTTDYSQYVDWTNIQIQDQVNVPTKLTFIMYALNWEFRIPVQRAYVRLFASSNNRALFTGLLSVEPTRQYVGLAAAGFRILGPTGSNLQDNAGQILKYTCTATSEDYLLSLKATPFIPAYINRTQGQILTDLANVLCPGYFDTTNIQDGDLVPYFNYDPTKAWSEVAKTFGDASRFRYKALDKKLFYVPYGDNDLGIIYDEVNQPESMFDPTTLQTQVLQVPTVNDVTIIGDAEGGNNHEDYFCGDGFTGNMQLLHKVFQGSSVVLLQDALTSNEVNTQNWYQLDPGANFHWESGAFNVVTAPTQPFGADGISVLGAQNGLELAGGLNLQHGEFVFNDVCSGILGGLYRDQTYADTEFICGFKAVSNPGGVTTSASGAVGVEIFPMFGDTDLSKNNPIVTQANHTYVLQTIVHAPAYTRWTQTYRTVDGEEYGGGSLTMTGSVTFNVQDYDITAATGFYYEPVVTQFNAQEVTLPDFAAYALVNNDVLNITDTNMLIAKMPLGGLSGLLGTLGLFTPSGLCLPAMQSDYIWGIPPSGNYFGQSVPPAPAAGYINHSPAGNQYYVGSVSTWGIVVASTSQGGSAASYVQATNYLDFGASANWGDMVGGSGGTPIPIPGAVTNNDTGGPNGGQLIFDIADNTSQPLRTILGNFDLINNGAVKDMTVTNSANPNNDRFVISFQQSQPVQDTIIVVFTDVSGNRSTFTFFFDAPSALNAWITLTAARSAFSTDAGFNWIQVAKMEMYNSGATALYPYHLLFAEGRWVGLVSTAATDPTVTTNTTFISLLTDPLFNVAPNPGEVVRGWTNTSDDSGQGSFFNYFASWGHIVGNPQVPGSGSVLLGLEWGPVGPIYLDPGADGQKARVTQVISTATTTISPGDQFTIGIYGMATEFNATFDGLELRFGISATVSYTDGTTSSAAAGGILGTANEWVQGANQVLIDPVREATQISISAFGYLHNPKAVPASWGNASWEMYLSLAELIKTPSAYSIYSAPVGLSTIPTNLVLGNGFDLQAAQITQGNDADTLAFYAQTSPAAGTPIRFQSWESQAAVSRLQDQNSIAYEAFIVEDDGIRSAIVSNLSPLPRTSEDCDSAAQAFLADRTSTGYNGTYTCSSLFFTPPEIINPEDGYGLGGYGLTPYGGTVLDDQFWPVSGRFLHVNAPPRGLVNQKFLVSGIQTSVLDEMSELVQFQITFGADLHLEKVLHNFVDLQPANVLTPSDKANPPDPRNVVDVSTTYLPDLSATYIPLGAITPTQVFVSFNDSIPAGAWLEVRLLDTNWGDTSKRDFIGRFSPPTNSGFWLPRKAYDQNWFMRLVANASTTGSSGSMTYGISGNVVSAPQGVTIEILELDVIVISDIGGNWAFTGIADQATYTIRPSLVGFTFTPQVQTVTVNGTDISGLHFVGSMGVYSVSGLVTDHNGVPMVGASVAWSGNGTGAITVSNQGNYTFFVLPGTFTITVTASGYGSASTSVTVTGGSVSGVNFILYIIPTFAVSGTVLDASQAPINGIVVTLTNTSTRATTTTQTNSSGFYSVQEPSGTYTVQPSSSSYTFNATTVTVSSSDVSGVNFGVGKTLSLTGITSSQTFGTLALSANIPGIQVFAVGTAEAFGVTPTLTANAPSPLLQSVVSIYSGGTTLSAMFASPVTAGSTLFIFGLTNNSPTITDTLGNTYTASTTGSGGFYCVNCLGGSNTVTFTFASDPGWATIIACEFSSASSGNGLDQAAYNTGSSTNPATSSVTTTANGELVLAYCTGGNGYGAGTGYTLIDNSTGDTVEFAVQSTAGSVSAGFTTAVNAAWFCNIWTFLPKP